MMGKLEENSILENIITDSTSGSSELLHKLNHFFITQFSHIVFSDEELKKLKEKFKSFAGIINFLDRLFSQSSDNERYNFLTQFAADFHNKMIRIANHLHTELGSMNKFISISNSFTLLSVLQSLLAEQKFEITISEARPKFEGRIMASRLSELGIHVKLCTEAQIPAFLENSDCAVVGADVLLPDGGIVNKTGTKILALCCAAANKPLYAISDKSKYSTSNEFDPKNSDSKEIWELNNSSILINNYYFEKIDNHLITKIITD